MVMQASAETSPIRSPAVRSFFGNCEGVCPSTMDTEIKQTIQTESDAILCILLMSGSKSNVFDIFTGLPAKKQRGGLKNRVKLMKNDCSNLAVSR